MFDAVVSDLSERYGLGDRSRELFGLLMGYIFNDRRGGFGGFVEGFREQGHGELVMSWFGQPDASRPLNAGDVGTVFGQGLLNDWAGRLGTSRATLAAAIAGVLPRLVAELTPNGRLPASVGTPFAIDPQSPAEEASGPSIAPQRAEPPVLSFQGPHRPVQPAAATPAETNRADAMMSALAAQADSAPSPPAARLDFEPQFRRHPPAQRKGGGRGWLWLAVVALIAGGTGYAWWLGLLDPYLAQIGLV